MKQRNKLFLILIGVILMISLFSCGKQKYKLNFNSDGFESKKLEYAAGDKVTVFFNMIASDTNYSFYLDDENINMANDYDGKHGYIFTFIMPDHDVTLFMESNNTMVYIPRINVVFTNEAEEADIWIIPQTEDNMKTGIWGKATIAKLPVNEKRELVLDKAWDAEHWIINIIAGDQYYSALDIVLEEGYSIIFGSETEESSGVQIKFIEILDCNGDSVYKNKDVFIGAFGAE